MSKDEGGTLCRSNCFCFLCIREAGKFRLYAHLTTLLVVKGKLEELELSVELSFIKKC